MTWREAFTHLAALSVPGVATSYDLDALPNALPAADLPALAPAFPETPGLPLEEGAGLSALTYDGSAWAALLVVDHILYWAPAWSERGLSAVLPDLLTAVDAYLAVISADGALGGALDFPLQIARVQPGMFDYAGTTYYGVRFRHVWRRVAA